MISMSRRFMDISLDLDRSVKYPSRYVQVGHIVWTWGPHHSLPPLALLPHSTSQPPWSEVHYSSKPFCHDVPVLQPATQKLNPLKPQAKVNVSLFKYCMSGVFVPGKGNLTNTIPLLPECPLLNLPVRPYASPTSTHLATTILELAQRMYVVLHEHARN